MSVPHQSRQGSSRLVGSFLERSPMTAIVLLSGGMDSAVALYWAAKTFHLGEVYALFFDYDQVAFDAECLAASHVWAKCAAQYTNLCSLQFVRFRPDSQIFIAASSITGRSEINQYEN